MKWLRLIVLIIAFLTMIAPLAHVLEMPAKFMLDGPVWLTIQQNLYRGWGIVFGPIEGLALICSIILFTMTKGDRLDRSGYLIAAVCYAAMIGYFFLFNDFVNNALNSWTAATMPANWTEYRLKWETGHGLAALFSLVAFVALLHAHIRDAPRAEPSSG